MMSVSAERILSECLSAVEERRCEVRGEWLLCVCGKICKRNVADGSKVKVNAQRCARRVPDTRSMQLHLEDSTSHAEKMAHISAGARVPPTAAGQCVRVFDTTGR